MKTKNIIFLVIAIVSSIGGIITASLLPECDGVPGIAWAPAFTYLYAIVLYANTYLEDISSLTPAEVYEHRRNSWVFRNLYHPFIFMGVTEYLMRNEWEKSEVLLACLESGYDPHPTTADYEEYKRQMEVGEHIKRLQQRLPLGLSYESLLELIFHYRKKITELEERLELNKNRKKYRIEILVEIKEHQSTLLKLEVALKEEKARKTANYKRIVLINLSKSLK